MRLGAAAKIAVPSLVRAFATKASAPPAFPRPAKLLCCYTLWNASPSVEPDVLILAKGYLACFMDTTAEGLTFASFSSNCPESEA